jgi:hypothetical protein
MQVFQFLVGSRLRAVSCLALASLGAGVSCRGARLDAFDQTTAADSSAFHLGTAAGLFGWSSAVADFNDDGRPDFTVADRSSRSAGGYSYRVVFAVAGRAVQSVSFESASSTLNVALRDVDDDHDLDVLITDAPTAAVNAVWLNDGHGRFVQGQTPISNTLWVALAALSPESEDRPPSSAEARIVAPAVRQTEGTRLEAGLQVSSFRIGAVSAWLTASALSRAPPASASLV